MEVRRAGFINGERDQNGTAQRGEADLVLAPVSDDIFTDDANTAKRQSFLINGESVIPGGFLDLLSVATAIDGSHVASVGDINRDGFDDIGAVKFEASPGLNGDGQIYHQVIEVYYGGDDFADRLDNGAPSFIFEPDSAPFYSQGFATPDEALLPEPFAFTAAGYTGSPLFTQTLDSTDGTQAGLWTDLSLAGALGGEAKISDALAGGVSTEWTFADLDPNRTYAINVNLPDLDASGFKLTSLAEYVIEGARDAVIDIPTGVPDTLGLNGERYFRLGDFQPDSSGVLVVSLGVYRSAAPAGNAC